MKVTSSCSNSNNATCFVNATLSLYSSKTKQDLEKYGAQEYNQGNNGPVNPQRNAIVRGTRDLVELGASMPVVGLLRSGGQALHVSRLIWRGRW